MRVGTLAHSLPKAGRVPYAVGNVGLVFGGRTNIARRTYQCPFDAQDYRRKSLPFIGGTFGDLSCLLSMI